MERRSHNHGTEEGEGLACRQHPTGDCIIQELTARAEAAEATLARVKDLAYQLLGEHGQSWNAISGRRVWSALHPTKP